MKASGCGTSGKEGGMGQVGLCTPFLTAGLAGPPTPVKGSGGSK